MGQKLDIFQERAVNTDSSRVLVIAGPGSGKTRVLTMRLARLVRGGVHPFRILAVTFTNRAAREMRERVAECGVSPAGLSAGTFHATSLRLLRALRPELRLLGRHEQAAIVKGLGFDAIEDALSNISAFKNGVLEPGDIDYGLLEGYGRKLEELSALDLDDLVPAATRLLAEKCLRPFSHIMIDEYQDINPAQARFVKELATGADGLLAIGDPDQAIYAFRGSDLGCFLDFQKDFPGAELINLSRNYRSAERIVSASRALISRNARRLENDITPVRHGGEIELVECADEKAEAMFLIKEIERLMGGLTSLTAADDTGMRFSDFAVLVRTNRQAEYIAAEFAASSVPFSAISSPVSEVRDFLESLKAACQPDGIAFGEYVIGHARAFGLGEEAIGLLKASLDGADEGAGISGLLDSIELAGPADWLDITADKVKIMTLHGAKGLEWRCVFIAGAEDGFLPMNMAADADIEEERRLFYVGMTRARDVLYLTHANRRHLWGARKDRTRSPFIGEMPPELMESRCLEKKAVKKKPVQKGLFD